MEKRSPLKTTALWACRLVLGGTFAVAAVLKIMDPAAFVADIGHYRLVSYPASVVFAIYLPWLELVAAVAVLLRWRERGALLLLSCLCALFAAALASAWWRGLDITCGCFGHAMTTTVPIAFARSLGLGGLSVLLLRRSRTEADGR